MLVQVHALEDNSKSLLQVDPEDPIKTLFPQISVKLSKVFFFRAENAL